MNQFDRDLSTLLSSAHLRAATAPHLRHQLTIKLSPTANNPNHEDISATSPAHNNPHPLNPRPISSISPIHPRNPNPNRRPQPPHHTHSNNNPPTNPNNPNNPNHNPNPSNLQSKLGTPQKTKQLLRSRLHKLRLPRRLKRLLQYKRPLHERCKWKSCLLSSGRRVHGDRIWRRCDGGGHLDDDDDDGDDECVGW